MIVINLTEIENEIVLESTIGHVNENVPVSAIMTTNHLKIANPPRLRRRKKKDPVLIKRQGLLNLKQAAVLPAP